MTKNEALRMAIEVFDMYGNKMNSAFADEAYQACKDALAETQKATEQAPCEQPVAWQALCVGNHYAYATAKLDLTGYHSDFWQRPLYTTPPKAEPQEPVAWMNDIAFSMDKELLGTRSRIVPLYTAPPSREWVGLSDEEIEEATGMQNQGFGSTYYMVIRAIEAKLREKNNG